VSVQSGRKVELATAVLRIAVSLEFLGHGILALSHKAQWMKYVAFWGIPAPAIPGVMTAVGTLDLILAFLVLAKPVRAALLWMAFWGFFTATLRPLTGEPFVEFVERGPNWGAPLALLILRGWPRTPADLWR
jgi:uncharacterized membrane protein YphA (DoxX/SURF4 family)